MMSSSCRPPPPPAVDVNVIDRIVKYNKNYIKNRKCLVIVCLIAAVVHQKKDQTTQKRSLFF